MGSTVECPRCGFDQPEGEECLSCGIVFSKYAQDGADAPAKLPDILEPVPVPSSTPPPTRPVTGGEAFQQHLGGVPPRPDAAGRFKFQYTRPQTEPIGQFAMILRALASLGCLGISILMVANGRGLVSVWPYVVMVFYAGVAVWGLTTFRASVTLRQFAVEMLALVALTLGLRAAQPDLFAVEAESEPTHASFAPALPQTPVGRFAGASVELTDTLVDVLTDPSPMSRAEWQAVDRKLDFAALRARYAALSDDDKAEVFDVWRRIRDFGATIEPVLDRFAIKGPETVELRPPEEAVAGLRAEAAKAQALARGLRARLLVFPSSHDARVSPEQFR